MRSIFRSVALALALIGLGGVAVAQGDAKQDDQVPPAAAPGASAAALAEPQPNETNAERAKTQPGNNAPFWRGVRNSGTTPGSVNNMQVGEHGRAGPGVHAVSRHPAHHRRRGMAADPQLVDHPARRRRHPVRRPGGRAVLQVARARSAGTGATPGA